MVRAVLQGQTVGELGPNLDRMRSTAHRDDAQGKLLAEHGRGRLEVVFELPGVLTRVLSNTGNQID